MWEVEASSRNLHFLLQAQYGRHGVKSTGSWEEGCWSKEHRLDAGGVEDADDCVPGSHPPAAHIPIGAGQVLCIQETLL